MKFLVSQVKLMLEKKSAVLVCGLIMVSVLMNYFRNVFQYQGRDLLEMYHPMTLGLFSEMGTQYPEFTYITLLFPFLVVLAAGMSYFEDHASGEELFLVSRVGKKQYYFGKVFAVFIATFIIFTLPLFLEMILDMIAFPSGAEGNPDNITIYDTIYTDRINNYFWTDLYLTSKYLYVIFRIVLLGVVSGLLAAFTAALSYLNIFKFRVFLFLPVYVLLYAVYYLVDLMEQRGILEKISAYYVCYLTYYNSDNKSASGMFVFMALVFLATCFLTAAAAGRDVMNQ